MFDVTFFYDFAFADFYSGDVALAVQWIFTNCNNNGEVGGSQAANGNGQLIVHVSRKFGVS
jgi:hypothetical protein